MSSWIRIFPRVIEGNDQDVSLPALRLLGASVLKAGFTEFVTVGQKKLRVHVLDAHIRDGQLEILATPKQSLLKTARWALLGYALATIFAGITNTLSWWHLVAPFLLVSFIWGFERLVFWFFGRRHVKKRMQCLLGEHLKPVEGDANDKVKG